jgi:hypothetical protein
MSVAYLSVDSFAGKLDTDDMTIRRLIADGLLEAINIARPGAKRARLRIPESELSRIRTDLALGARGRRRRSP